jgi:hypothetical protein
MQVTQVQSYQEQYAGSSITFNQYVIKKTGLLQAQTVLSVDTFSLNCIPYQLSMERAIMLATLSPNEIQFFQKYKDQLGSLSLLFTRQGRSEPLKIFIRCAIQQIATMKGKEGLALVVLDIKNCPQDLVIVIGEYFSFMEKLELQYSDFKDKMIQITPAVASQLEFNNFAAFGTGDSGLRVQLFSLSTNKAEFLAAPSSKEFEKGTSKPMRLYFRSYQFSVNATVKESQRLPTGVVRTKVDLEFSPELVEIVDFYYFKARAQQKKAADSA